MTSVRIVTDTTADIPQSLLEKYRIEAVPLKVHFGDRTYLDRVELGPEDFYRELVRADKPPTTSQPSPGDFLQVYKRILEDDPDAHILSIHLSSALSGTCQSARMARDLLGEDANITVLDSRSASIGSGLLALSAAQAAGQGLDVEECIKRVHYLRERTGLYFLVDTLEYLQKGGRIGKAAALVGAMLNIKPILTIDDEGEVASADKVRGKKKAVDRMVERLGGHFAENEEIRVYIPHAQAEDSARMLGERVRSVFRVRDILYTQVGPVIGTHAGPGTLGLIAVPAGDE